MQARENIVGVTGGGRSVAAPGFGAIDFTSLPSDTRVENLSLPAQDGGVSRGVIYSRGGERTVVCFTHPRADMMRHYVIDGLLEAGFAAFAQSSRWLNNDIACIHEKLLLDIAAGMRLLRDRGFERIILLGNSGGGSLYTFYQAQASAPPSGRLTETPGGEAFDLNAFDLPEADGLILLAAHLGQGRFLLDGIDPSVVEETDMLAVDPALDMYDPRNGFAEPPTWSRYSAEFLERYRAGQRARVARLDAIARSRIAAQRAFKADLAATPADADPGRRAFLGRRATALPLMTIYRTDANPASLDDTIMPSNRILGSLVSRRPDLSNYAAGGFAGVLTPEAWLSTWSGLSSKAATLDNIGHVRVPTLLVNYDGDAGLFPHQAERVIAASGAADTALVHISGDHYGNPTERTRGPDPRLEAKRVIASWLQERY